MRQYKKSLRYFDNFWSFVEITKGCWIWKGNKNKLGYGHFYKTIGGKSVLIMAHRFAYEDAKRTIPLNYQIHHICENPSCVKPSHLRALTRDDHRRVHKKAHCPQGHPYSGDNAYVRKEGYPSCRECGRTRARIKYREEKGLAGSGMSRIGISWK